MKKITVLAICLAICLFSFAACVEQNGPDPSSATPSGTSSTDSAGGGDVGDSSDLPPEPSSDVTPSETASSEDVSSETSSESTSSTASATDDPSSAPASSDVASEPSSDVSSEPSENEGEYLPGWN